ncbi:hypothetical protein [Campylobacter concisus]
MPTSHHFKLPSSNNKHLNFSLLNFAKENNFTLRDDKDSAMFDIKLRLAHGNNIVPTSASSSGLTLTINNLIIENEDGKVSEDIDKIYLHHCFDKSIYESISLVKNEDSDIKNSYTATFNIPIDKENKGDTKFILYSSDLSKVYSTKDIHAHTDTAVISLGYQDKSNSNFCYSNKVSLRDIADHITNVISDSEYPFKTNEPICLKAIYKQEKGSKRYKEILWGYKVIKSKEYDELSKSNPKDVVGLKDQKGKEITFKISDVIQKDDLDKLKQGSHTIVFFAYLEGDKDKFKFYTRYGKNHIRIDIKIPLYIKFKDDKLVIYEFEHAIKEKSFDAKLKLSDNKDDALIKNDNYLYINKNISSNEINIYEDDKLSKELKSDENTNKRYQIYAKEESSNNQSNEDKDDKLGINLLNKENMDKFINSFNESKSLTRVNKDMWEDGDEGVGVDVNNKIYNILIEGTMENSKMGNGLLYLKENDDIILSITMVAGGFGSGAPQNGEYTVDTYRNRRKDKDYNPGMNIHGVGFSFNLNPQFKTERSLLRIHPDGNNKGTLGCIGVTGTQKELLEFEEIMKNLLKHKKSIHATINIKNNPNNSKPPKKIIVKE